MGAVKQTKYAFDAAKGTLEGVKLANAAAFALIQGMLKFPFGVDYFSVSGTLTTDFLKSEISAKARFHVGSKNFDIGLTIALNDIPGIVAKLFKYVIEYFKELFPVGEESELEVQEKERITKLHKVAMAYSEKLIQRTSRYHQSNAEL